MQKVGALALGVVLAVSGCGAFDAPDPAASCVQRLIIDGATYTLFEGDLVVAGTGGSPTDIRPGEPVAGAEYGGCDDGGGLTGGGPTEAWRATGLDDSYVLTATQCARMEGTEAADDCDPDAYPYLLWKRTS